MVLALSINIKISVSRDVDTDVHTMATTAMIDDPA